MSGLSITALSSAVPLASALGLNLGLVKCIDWITADMPRMPGSGHLAEVLLVALASIALFKIVHEAREKKSWAAGRAKHFAIVCIAGALLSLLAYRTMASVYIIEVESPIATASDDAELDTETSVFLRPLFVRGPRTRGDPLKPTVHEYMATWRGQGGWRAAAEMDSDGLGTLIEEQDPLARPLTCAAFVGVYGIVIFSLTLGLAFAWPVSENSGSTDDSSAQVEMEAKPTQAQAANRVTHTGLVSEKHTDSTVHRSSC